MTVLRQGVPAARIHIVGGSGMGKTTLAKRLAEALGIEPIHLDDIADRLDGTGVDAILERRKLAADIGRGRTWVTEGIHLDWTDALFREADVIVWLDDARPRTATVRVIRRFVAQSIAESRRRGLRQFIRPRSYVRHLIALVAAIGKIRNYERTASTARDSRRATAERLEGYHGKVVHCRQPGDRDALVASLVALRLGALASDSASRELLEA